MKCLQVPVKAIIDAIEPLKRTPGKKVPAAAQLQHAMDAAVDQLRSTLAAMSLADMLPKGKTAKATVRSSERSKRLARGSKPQRAKE